MICGFINEAIPFGTRVSSTSRAVNHPENLQHNFHWQCLSKGLNLLLNQHLLTKDAARLRSTLIGKSLGAWLQAIPTEGHLHWIPVNSIGGVLEVGYHLTTYWLDPYRTWRVCCWMEQLLSWLEHPPQSRIHTSILQQWRQAWHCCFDSGNRPCKDLDIAMAHLWTMGALRNFAQESGYAASVQTKRKRVWSMNKSVPGEQLSFIRSTHLRTLQMFGLWSSRLSERWTHCPKDQEMLRGGQQNLNSEGIGEKNLSPIPQISCQGHAA